MRVSELARRRMHGTFVVDEWGLDTDLTRVASSVAVLRWSIEAVGFEHVPEAGSAVLVIGPRAKVSEPAVVATATRRETGRHLRPAELGRFATARAVARRLGSIPPDPDEISGLLRTGALVGFLCDRHRLGTPGPGAIDPSLISVALELDVPVLPVAVRGHELGRRWTVRVGPPLVPDGTGPLAAVAMAEAAVVTIGDLLA